MKKIKAKLVLRFVKSIIDSDLPWEDKYELFFPHVLRLANSLGSPFDYSDPDSTYEDDVLACYHAVAAMVGEILSEEES